MSDFPKEAEALLSVAPDDFVTERNRLARELRLSRVSPVSDDGQPDLTQI